MPVFRTTYTCIRGWVVAHEKHLIAGCVTLLAVMGSFLFGFYSGAAHRDTPSTTIVRAAQPVVQHLPEKGESAQNATTPLTARDCMFVGSAKGTKYYPPTCAYAKNIARENLRCFTSAEQAQQEGYTRSKSC